MSRIRLLLTTSDLSGGGAEREFRTLLEHLDRDRFEMHVALWRHDTEQPPPHDLPLTILRKDRSWHVLRAVRGLAHLVDDFKPDVVFSMLQYPNLVTGSALRRARHCPRWVCRFLLSPQRDLRGLKQTWARRVLPRANVVLSCADGLTRELQAFLGTTNVPVQTIRNPLDVSAIRLRSTRSDVQLPDSGGFTIVHSGRFVPQKNQRLLLHAFAGMEDRSSRLWMLGEGPLESQLRSKARELGVADRVDWLGFQTNPYPFYRAADCMVLSSDWEGLPNVILECMVCETPVISTQCPHGPDELIEDGVTGCLVPTGDMGAMTAALNRLHGDDSLRRKISLAAHAAVEDAYGNARSIQEYSALFQRLAKETSA
ncbi:MAG: glycosyltransferase [Verrucomicrobia bacterium]|nr:glycosyltransferase [Verrucomicrobiota bacterium]